MSTKNTPLNERCKSSENFNNSTPNSIRKRVLHKTAASGSSKTNLPESLEKGKSNSLLNIAFSQPSSTSKTPRTPKSSASGVKFKQAPTILNACYTPSSLYRVTPSGGTPASLLKSTKKSSTPKHIGKKLICNGEQQQQQQKTLECFSKVSLIETPSRPGSSGGGRGSKSHIIGDTNKSKDNSSEISNLTVAVRVRPLNSQECLNPSTTNIVQVIGNEVIVFTGTSADNSLGVTHSFHYDRAFCSSNSDDVHYANQETVFQGTGQILVEKAFEGYNACLFAYGQTGSGKSYSMMGIETDDTDDICKNPEAGIIPRFCYELFKRIEELGNNIQAEIEVSYFEIYNEKIHDLLCVSQQSDGGGSHNVVGGGKKNALKVREHPIWGPYIVDLSTHPVDSYTAVRNWLAVGNSQRATAATGMNDKSSRSHSIFNIVLNLSEYENDDGSNGSKIKQVRRSKISLVDLAGSERISHGGVSGERIREGVSINKSLLTLGKVIAALADSKKGGNFVPYRESVLTWLLRESLGGNSRTVMLATISPASIHLDETLSTLRYACQARTIVNRVKVNEDPHDRVIRELRAEVERLQALRQDYERQKRYSANSNNIAPRKIIIETSVDDSEVEALRVQLAETEKELSKAQKSWMERLKEAEDLRKSEIRLLRRKGLALELSAEQKQACLVNLAADPILSGTLFYILPTGVVRIGRSRPSAFAQPDIVLEGPLVAFQHCSIENTNGKLFIVPENDEFETYLNGELLREKRQMYHGDRLVIGGSHYFRISNPFCSRRHQTNVVDYQLAHQEILQKQEDQLRRELDEEKRAALSQIELERATNERNYQERMEMLELEKFKYECSKELLETEKEALKNDKFNGTTKFEYTPSSHKSTLLDDIKRIMQHPSEESLHQTQLKVKEATQRCREIGAKLEFKQSQVLDEFGIFRAVVLIIDKENKRKAEWPTARLDVWLEIVRNNETTKREDLFKCVDIEWNPCNDNLDETLNDSLNSSRISLDVSVVKEAIRKQQPLNGFQKLRNLFNGNKEQLPEINEQLPQINEQLPKIKEQQDLTKSAILYSSSRNLENTKKMLTYDDEDCNNTRWPNKRPQCSSSSSLFDKNFSSKMQSSSSFDKNFSSSAYVYLKDMQKSTLKLKKLCDRYGKNENNATAEKMPPPIEHFKKALDNIETIIFDLKATLTEQKLAESPKTPKSVRFLLD